MMHMSGCDTMCCAKLPYGLFCAADGAVTAASSDAEALAAYARLGGPCAALEKLLDSAEDAAHACMLSDRKRSRLSFPTSRLSSASPWLRRACWT